MWPFKQKTVPVVVPSIAEQIEHALKSISFPQAQPTFKLKARKRSDWDFKTAVVEGYNASAIVYSSVEKRAKLIASVPWKAVKKNAEGQYEHEPNSALQALLDNPNPDQSWLELMYLASQSLDLAGMSFITKLKAGVNGYPQEIWYHSPDYVSIAPGSQRLVDHYELRRRKVETEDMIMLRMPNPSDPVFGMPVLMGAGRPTDIDRESGIWQKTSLENRGSSDINIKLPENATAEQVELIKKQYKKNQAGAKNARKALVSNADVQQLGQTAVELDFVASRRSVWTEICAVFGLSLSNLGMTESVNLANANAMDRALWKNTIIPQLELIKRQLDRQLAADFGPEWRVVPDLTNVEALQENRNELLDAGVKLFGMGVPFSEINQRLELGFDEFEGAGVSYLPSGLIPASFNTEPNDLPEEAED